VRRPRLSAGELDFHGEHRSDPEWLTHAWKRAVVVVVDPERERFAADPSGLVYLDADSAPEGRRVYLGGEDPPVFAVIADVPDGLGLRDAGHGWSPYDLGVAAQAQGIAHWHRTYQRHPMTGEPLKPELGGWELVAPSGARVYPRTDPAVIVLIDDGGDRVLLARHRKYPGGRFACIAGFVEPGESAEAAVRREVSEEVGIDVDGINYVASQPWPFPRSLMLAYEATADPGQRLRLQEDEIAEARWFHENEVRDTLRMWERGPASISVARFLIERWLEPR
jgi:NAD+ diphosphatase